MWEKVRAALSDLFKGAACLWLICRNFVTSVCHCAANTQTLVRPDYLWENSQKLSQKTSTYYEHERKILLLQPEEALLYLLCVHYYQKFREKRNSSLSHFWQYCTWILKLLEPQKFSDVFAFSQALVQILKSLISTDEKQRGGIIHSFVKESDDSKLPLRLKNM